MAMNQVHRFAVAAIWPLDCTPPAKMCRKLLLLIMVAGVAHAETLRLSLPVARRRRAGQRVFGAAGGERCRRRRGPSVCDRATRRNAGGVARGRCCVVSTRPQSGAR